MLLDDKPILYSSHLVWNTDCAKQNLTLSDPFTEIETATVNNLGTVHDLVFLAAFEKHTSVRGFIDAIRARGGITEKEFGTLTHIDRSIQLISQVFQDASTRTDARDNALLEEVLESGVWVCAELCVYVIHP